MRALPGLLRASHPEPGAAVTAVAILLAMGVGHDAAGAALVGLTVLATQLAVGWTNDWLDAERDRAVERSDKPLATGAVSRRVVGIAGLAAAVATPLIGLTLGLPAATAITAALVSALLYNWPLKFTPASVLPYAFSFAALPAFVILALPDSPRPPAWIVAAGGLLGAGAHFANVLPDLDDDVRTGVRGLPHLIGAAWSRAAAAGLLFAATLTLVFGPPGRPSWYGVAAIAAAVVVLPAGWYAGRLASSRGARPVAVFRAVLVVALIDVLLLVTSGRVV
ncbi:UbiA family prenyltransferase [Phytohabitans sp. ZYX-F-186]|uniref:UbiA family prenyltransferase n=1 Tax=Phytohabitans maris TaxID=3071409 RepID=A0ABU0ZVZ5_9ACTN|nr:UbiA family prenyltransferase [Phytohabitans sp. ZYX-F-186]MDQ7910682.1 UbiA family prenyltransferase [Phytohabitans sp. ZYX-F-186]